MIILPTWIQVMRGHDRRCRAVHRRLNYGRWLYIYIHTVYIHVYTCIYMYVYTRTHLFIPLSYKSDFIFLGLFDLHLKGYSPQNENVAINLLPPCRSKPIKALFVFGTQFKIFWMKTGRQTLFKMALRWRRWDELLNKVVIFIFFAYKKYSRHFIKFRLNHWWQMDYFDDVFHSFLDLDSVIYLAVDGDSHKPPGSHPKYLKLCSEDEQSFYGFGVKVINYYIFILRWSNPLNKVNKKLYFLGAKS